MTQLDLPFDKEFLETFNAEAREKLQNLSDGLLSLEESAEDEDGIRTLFREAHTLKGSAGMMGFDAIKSLAHRIEDILSGVQKGQFLLDQGKTDVILEAIDRIEALLPTGEESDKADDNVSDLLERMGEFQQDSPEPTAAVDCEADGGEQDEPGQADTVKTAPPKARKQTEPTIRVNIDRLDKLLNLMGEIIVNQIGTEGHVSELANLKEKSHELVQLFKSITRDIEELRSSLDSNQADSLSQKINKAGDTATAVSAALDSAAANLRESTASHRLALKELHDSTLNVRMLPLATIFSQYPRVVRDASRSCGKKARLLISGEKTELDKRILEQISDPLLHIIRNCVDHGIESTATREAAGKPEQGTIRLSAEQRGDMVDIIIEDDGAGIDVARVKAVAVQKGLINAENDMDDDRALELIFRSGFSTAEKVTDISGRGVGMDVVKNNIEQLDGTVTVTTELGQGTRIEVALPVTLVVIDGLLVEGGDQKFVVPVSSVREMVVVTPEEVQSLGSQRGFLMRDTAIPLVDMLDALGRGQISDRQGKSHVIVIQNGSYNLGLQVERLIGEQEIVIKPLSPFLGHHPFISGVSILSGGEIAVVLNVLEMASSLAAGEGAAPMTARTGNGEQQQRKRSVLVVEDSLVVRELQRNILEAAGYEVNTAVDGRDALSRLDNDPVDCIVTDIEMPGMDGFELTVAIRQREDVGETPVIMVTSLNSEEHKKKGIEVGADAYVVKGSFDQKDLLETIERLVA